MAYLNWKDRNVTARVEVLNPDSATEKLALEMGLDHALVNELELALSELKESAAELRVDLPNGWTLFWKLKTSGSRLLMAHPEETVWVATFALEKEHLKAVETSLRAMQATEVIEGFKVEELIEQAEQGSLDRVSNLTCRISLQNKS